MFLEIISKLRKLIFLSHSWAIGHVLETFISVFGNGKLPIVCVTQQMDCPIMDPPDSSVFIHGVYTEFKITINMEHAYIK